MRRLPDVWMDKIFAKLHGIYGAQFKSKFSYLENGVDVGLLNAKATWAEELGNLIEHPEAIAYALKHLPDGHAPNAIQFLDLCRKAPPKQRIALENHSSVESRVNASEFAAKAAKVMAEEKNGLDWVHRPRSKGAFDMAMEAAKKDHRLKRIISSLVDQGIVVDGKLVKRWNGQDWVKA